MLKKIWKNSLYKNSLYLMFNAGATAVLGFVFWNIVARLYTSAEVGIASTLISLVGMIILLSSLGFNISLIRYLPLHKGERSKIINSVLTITGLTSIIISIIFVLAMGSFSETLSFIRENLVYSLVFIIGATANVWFLLIEAIFIAYRKSKLVFTRNMIASILKIVLIFFLVSLGGFGIFLGWYIGLITALLVTLFLIGVKIIPEIDWDIIKRMFHYSGGNYISHLFSMLPTFGLPIFIAYFLGFENTAYFYISWTIASLIFFVPQNVGRSLLSEGSHDKKNGDPKKALKFSYAIVIVGIILGIAMAKILLGLFGEEYLTGGFTLLIILLLSSLFYTYNSLLVMYYNLKHKINKVISINLKISLLTFIFSYFLIPYGLTGIGFGWLAANFIVSLVNIGELKKWQ